MPEIYHTYADVSDLRDYLAGTSYSSNWTADTVALRRMLQAASRRMDDYVGGDGLNTWGPYIQTKVFDIGTRNEPRYRAPGNGIAPVDRLVNVLTLGGWCVSITSVTVYDNTARGSSETWTEGYANDYFLEPYNTTPKLFLAVNEDTSKALSAGQQVLHIAGTWGWRNTSADTGVTLNATITDSVTAIVLSAGSSDVSEGETLLIGTEQMYVEAVSGVNLTVVRGVHGTTAAAHTGGDAIYYYTYPDDVKQACLELARIEYRSRDITTEESFGTPTTIYPASEVKNALRRLARYVAHTDTSGVIF